MSETHDEFETGRRAGLNPASDYGGREQMQIANEAIKRIKSEPTDMHVDENQPSLFLPESLEVDPDAVPDAHEIEMQKRRAMLGSRATKETVSKPDEIKIPRKSARDREFENMAATEERRKLRSSLNSRGRGPGA